MKSKFLSWLLLGSMMSVVADEAKAGGGGGSPAEPEPTTPPEKEETEEQALAPEKQEAPAAKPGLVAQVLAGLKDKASLNSEITLQASRIVELESLVSTLTKEKEELTLENAELTADFATIDAALKTSESKAATVDQAAAAKIVDAGFSTKELPGAIAADEETIESLEEKLEAETNPKERFRIQSKINKLEATD